MVLFMLAMHPECQKKVYDELVSIFPNKDVYVDIDDLNKLLYLDMCVKEALRVLPTVPIVARKTRDDIQLRDYKIPAGTSIGIDIFSLHRSKKVWGEKADQFIPERFELGEELPHAYAYMAFSHGSRNCIVSVISHYPNNYFKQNFQIVKGYRYALVAIKLNLVYMLLNYRFTTTLKMSDLNYYAEVNLFVKEKLMVQIHNR